MSLAIQAIEKTAGSGGEMKRSRQLIAEMKKARKAGKEWTPSLRARGTAAAAKYKASQIDPLKRTTAQRLQQYRKAQNVLKKSVPKDMADKVPGVVEALKASQPEMKRQGLGLLGPVKKSPSPLAKTQLAKIKKSQLAKIKRVG